MEVSKSIFKRQADFLEKNGKYLLQFTLDFSYLNKYDTNTIDAVSIFDNLKPYLKRRISDNHKELSLNSFNVENNNIILHVYVGEFGDQSYYIIIDKNKRKVIRISKLWRKESISLEKENKLD